MHISIRSFFFFTPVCRCVDMKTTTCTRRLTEGGWKREFLENSTGLVSESGQRNGFSKPFKMLRMALVYTKWYQDFPYYRLGSLLITSACRAIHVRCSILPFTIGRHSYRFFIQRLWFGESQVCSFVVNDSFDIQANVATRTLIHNISSISFHLSIIACLFPPRILFNVLRVCPVSTNAKTVNITTLRCFIIYEL